jgi:hypothetical protein
MRSILLVFALASGLALSGCNSAQTPSANFLAFVTAVTTKVEATCSFIMSAPAQDISAILAASNPALQTIDAIAAAVCKAVGPMPVGASVGPLAEVTANVAGVVVHGHFK